MELFLSFFGQFFFLSFTLGLFSAFDFSIIVSVKSFHVGVCSAVSRSISWAQVLPVVTGESG